MEEGAESVEWGFSVYTEISTLKGLKTEFLYLAFPPSRQRLKLKEEDLCHKRKTVQILQKGMRKL